VTRAAHDTANLKLKRRLSHGPNTLTNEAITVVFYLHVLSATVWIGGLIVMGGLVPAVRKATDDRAVIQAMARRFGVISWIALGVLVITGGVLATDNWSQTLIFKVGLVLIAVMLAAWHSVMGSNQSPKTRGVTQAVILLLSLVILAAALNL
jgi:putative copper export protein